MSEKGLTEKQRRFVEAYMGEAAGNATAAARMAGYKGNEITLAAVGSENLRKPQVSEAIRGRVDSDPKIASREERQRLWTRIMSGEETETQVTSTGALVRRPARMSDRIKASELLGKCQGDFIERHEVAGPGGGPVQMAHLSREDYVKMPPAELEARLAILTRNLALLPPAPDKKSDAVDATFVAVDKTNQPAPALPPGQTKRITDG